MSTPPTAARRRRFVLVVCAVAALIATLFTYEAASASVATNSGATDIGAPASYTAGRLDCSHQAAIPYYTAAQQSNTLAFLEAIKAALPPLQSRWQCENFCAWEGVRCNGEGVDVSLDSATLYGSLPEVPSNVDDDAIVLTSFELYGESQTLHGDMPWSWMFIPSLVSLKLRGVGISGNAQSVLAPPSRMADLRAINRVFGATTALLSGTVTTRKASSLAVWDVANNNLGGTLPEIYSSYFPKAYAFYLNGNNFTGTLPASWSSMKSMGILYLYNNSITGSIPPQWADMANISSIRLETNHLCGCVPGELQGLETGLGGRKKLNLTTDDYIRSPECETKYACDYSSSSSSSSPAVSSSSSSSPSASSSSSVDECFAPVTIYTAAQQEATRVFLLAFRDAYTLEWDESCSNFCAWQYVDCTLKGVELNMGGAAVSGELPALSSAVDAVSVVLVKVDVSNTFTEGVLPDSWASLPRMQNITVSQTFIVGSVPEAWSAMNSLEYFDGSGMMVSGTLPSTWSALAKLKVLLLNNNIQMQGALPSSWSAMSSLEVLSLRRINAVGTLPESWSALLSLKEFHVDHNSLDGAIPESYSNWHSLATASLESNKFCGCLPSDWVARRTTTLAVTGDAPLLADDCAVVNTCAFSLESSSSPAVSSSSSSSSPSASSSSSSDLCNAPITMYSDAEVACTRLFVNGFALTFAFLTPVRVCSNFCVYEGVTCAANGVSVDLSGVGSDITLPAIPDGCAGSEVMIKRIDVGNSDNPVSVSGSLPDSWSSLTHLTYLDLSHTGVSGTLPPDWSVMNLEVVNLGYNALSGSIPASWGDMSALTELYLNNNGLTGSIPLELMFAENITILDVSNNQLSGGLPTVKKGKTGLRVFGSDLQRKTAK